MYSGPMRRPAALRVIGTLCAISLFACGGAAELSVREPPEAPRRQAPTMAPPTIEGDIIRTTIVREDFDSRFFVESSSVALIDVNRGVVSLPVEQFPSSDEDNLTDVDGLMQVSGVVEAGSIIVQPRGTLEAADAVELRAKDELRVSGVIRAGPGGVTLIAGRALSIDGTIQSEGPIRLRLGDNGGTVEILGDISTLATHQRRSADISIVGRGDVRIRGTVRTGEAELADSGDISINTYGAIQIEGTDAEVRSGDSMHGRAGDVSLTTEQSVELLYGAQLIGGDGTNTEDNLRIEIAGGSVVVRSGTVLIGFGGGIAGGRALAGQGGAVDVTAESTVTIEHVVSVVAGAGTRGGRMTIVSDRLSVGEMSTLVGGTGEQASGDAFVTTIGEASLAAAASIVGGAGGCTDGGALLLRIGGRLTVDPTSSLRGGQGGEAVGDTCVGRFAGGSVQIFAREVSGPLDAVATPGGGGTSGLQQIVIEPTYELKALPQIRIRTEGLVDSKVIDRGLDNAQLVPRLIESRLEAPPMTVAVIRLAGADQPLGPYSPWVTASVSQPELLQPLAGYRYLRYRIQLRGRALDAPVVDGFELDLAPR